MTKRKIIFEKMVENAIIPFKAHPGDLGYDLFSTEEVIILAGETKLISTGIRAAFPSGFGAKIFDRSSMATTHGVIVLAGVIDEGYRGEIKVALLNTNVDRNLTFIVRKNMKIAQMVPLQVHTFDVVEGTVDEKKTSRGAGGFGSTGT